MRSSIQSMKDIRTIFFAPPDIITGKIGSTQIKDGAVDLKRVMMTVIIAMIPCFDFWNVECRASTLLSYRWSKPTSARG